MFDRETEGLIELARQERDAIERGHMELKDAMHLPQGTRVENGKVILPPTGFSFYSALISIAGIFGILVLICALAGVLLLTPVGGVQIYIVLLAILGCLSVGAVLFVYRDIRSHPVAAICQIVVGAVAGAIILLFSSDNTATMLAGVAGSVITIADGFAHLRAAKAATNHAPIS